MQLCLSLLLCLCLLQKQGAPWTCASPTPAWTRACASSGRGATAASATAGKGPTVRPVRISSPSQLIPHLHLSLEQRSHCNSWTAVWWPGFGAGVVSIIWKVGRFGLLRGARASLKKLCIFIPSLSELTVRGAQQGLIILVIFHSVLFPFSPLPC